MTTITPATIAELREDIELTKSAYCKGVWVKHEHLIALLDALEAERARPLNLMTIDCPCGTRHVFSKKDAEEEYTYSRTQAEGKRDE